MSEALTSTRPPMPGGEEGRGGQLDGQGGGEEGKGGASSQNFLYLFLFFRARGNRFTQSFLLIFFEKHSTDSGSAEEGGMGTGKQHHRRLI